MKLFCTGKSFCGCKICQLPFDEEYDSDENVDEKSDDVSDENADDDSDKNSDENFDDDSDENGDENADDD